ncbi:hypothetical protein [Burkholderia lata]|uniref:hypothetical protein n=1 Tax=Burkholderia lata (strain ATCC 17760 / DSM 23089 / LMG 22485 / NCIMB 9086 / R18194 / 383) TaxID=482957 RepID=UPI0015821D6A|nr:hypothetical protein [Burkholderia lata]
MTHEMFPSLQRPSSSSVRRCSVSGLDKVNCRASSGVDEADAALHDQNDHYQTRARIEELLASDCHFPESCIFDHLVFAWMRHDRRVVYVESGGLRYGLAVDLCAAITRILEQSNGNFEL